MDFLNQFLNKAYDTVGLKVLNDAAQNVKELRLVGALLIMAMFGAAGVGLFQGNYGLAAGVILFLFVLMLLLIILGAVSTNENKWLAWVLSWAILLMFLVFMGVVMSAWATDKPRPLKELFQLDNAAISLDDIEIKLERDPEDNLILTTLGVPSHPHTIKVNLRDPKSNESLKSATLPLPAPGGNANPSTTFQNVPKTEDIICDLSLLVGKKVIQTRSIPIKVTMSKPL